MRDPGNEVAILYTAGVQKRRDRKFANNAVPDLNENIGGSTDLPTSIQPPHNYKSFVKGQGSIKT